MEATESKVRIEIHLSVEETGLLDSFAKQEGRSRKNLCETESREVIQTFFSGANRIKITGYQ